MILITDKKKTLNLTQDEILSLDVYDDKGNISKNFKKLLANEDMMCVSIVNFMYFNTLSISKE